MYTFYANNAFIAVRKPHLYAFLGEVNHNIYKATLI